MCQPYSGRDIIKKKAASSEAAFLNMVAMAGLEPATPAL